MGIPVAACRYFHEELCPDPDGGRKYGTIKRRIRSIAEPARLFLYYILPLDYRALYPLGEITGAEPDPWVIRGVSTRDRVLHFEQFASRDSL
ncbi:hypothetical protein [Methanoregula sp.]|uniref:hypothetical protein n=1 Tax=Methanoregula sp. TaxID=2052170 RepID=UPI002372BD02|nr:hypothetical protein [Methanoregula sp.]MDD1686324.1 hypothetical protein [Methanoregula sp.]